MVEQNVDGPSFTERLMAETLEKVVRPGLMAQYQKFFSERWQEKKMNQLSRKGPYQAYGNLDSLSPEDKTYYLERLENDDLVKNLARKDAIIDLESWLNNYKYNFEYDGEMSRALDRVFQNIRDQARGRYIEPSEMPYEKRATKMPKIDLNQFEDKWLDPKQIIQET